MGIDEEINKAFAKSQLAAGNKLPLSGTAFISVKNEDKSELVIDIVKKLEFLGFDIIATGGTCSFLTGNKINCESVNKVLEGRPNIVDHLKNGDVQLVINTTLGKKEIAQSYSIRRTALINNVPYFTTLAGAKAAAGAIEVMINEGLNVKALQEYY